jgi:hypothetical protein
VGKYDPLRRYLRRSKTPDVVLSFVEIERIIGGMLPHSAARPQWWDSIAPPHQKHVQQAAWREAGFKACLVAGAEKVRFERAEAGRAAG